MKNEDYTVEYLRSCILEWSWGTAPNTWRIEGQFNGFIPDAFFELEELFHVSQLHFHTCKLTSLPNQLFDLPNLELLCFSENELSYVPKEICKLTKLISLGLDRNKLISFPEHLLQMPALLEIKLSNNHITHIPEDIYKYDHYPQIDLKGNLIQNIPEEIILQNKTKVFGYLIQKALNQKHELKWKIDQRFKNIVADFLLYFNEYVRKFGGREDLFITVKETREEVAIELDPNTTDQQIADLQFYYNQYKDLLVQADPFSYKSSLKQQFHYDEQSVIMRANIVELEGKLANIHNRLETALLQIEAKDATITHRDRTIYYLLSFLDDVKFGQIKETHHLPVNVNVNVQVNNQITPYDKQLNESLSQLPDHRFEYLNGITYEMTGASRIHQTVAGNLFFALKGGLNGRGCQVNYADLALHFADRRDFCYPDMVVECPPGTEDYALHLTLIVEVLSPYTRLYDLSIKKNAYLMIASLRHLLFVDPQILSVEHYFRSDETWEYECLSNPDDSIFLATWDLHIPLSEIYGY